jgi:dihydroorotate dehydrogenase (fumarate)
MDLTTRYLGLRLRNPLVAGAGPLTGALDTIRRLEDYGAGAIVLPSIFEEQIEHEAELLESLIATGADSHPEAVGYFPASVSYDTGPGPYLDLVRRATEAVRIPIIASLNGITDHGWVDYARQIEEAGASALELNIYFIPADIEMTGRDVERRYVDILKAVKRTVRIPVAVKLGPYFSATGHMAMQLEQAGADGLVLFNRFYQPDIDLGRLALLSDLALSTAAEIRLPLLWIGVLAGRLKASLAASTGVESADEIVKYLLAGADVVMTTSALLRHGVEYMKVLREGLESWLAMREIETLDSLRGRMSQRNVMDPTAFERANYIKILQGLR